MLELVDLHLHIGNNHILKGINLTINAGETIILFGPNGCGKTSLVMAIMGMPDYIPSRGKILFKGKDITHAPSFERARMGIGMSFQRPPTIHGLKTRHLVGLCSRSVEADIDSLADTVNFRHLLDRDINDGFSGGEIKRSELLQLMAQHPDLLLFDEPESGVDLDNMALIGRTIQSLLTGRNSMTASLIITHTGYILDYLQADRGYILWDGRLQCCENPRFILDHIRSRGYRECVRCLQGR